MAKKKEKWKGNNPSGTLGREMELCGVAHSFQKKGYNRVLGHMREI